PARVGHHHAVPAVPQAHHLQHLPHPRLHRGGGHAVEGRMEPEVLRAGQVVVQRGVLEDQPMLRRTASRSAVTSWPAAHAGPEVGRASVHSILIVVDLPAPLGPRKPNVSPTGTSKSMPRTALISPKFLVRPATVIAGRWCPFAAWAAGPDIPCTATLP